MASVPAPRPHIPGISAAAAGSGRVDGVAFGAAEHATDGNNYATESQQQNRCRRFQTGRDRATVRVSGTAREESGACARGMGGGLQRSRAFNSTSLLLLASLAAAAAPLACAFSGGSSAPLARPFAFGRLAAGAEGSTEESALPPSPPSYSAMRPTSKVRHQIYASTSSGAKSPTMSAVMSSASAPNRSTTLAFYSVEAAEKYHTMMQSEDELKFYRVDLTDLVKLVRPGLPILDIGCGTGDLLNLVRGASPEAKLVGIDIVEAMLVHARTLVPSASFVLGDATSIDLPDSSVGAIMCTFVTHHLTDSDFISAVAEMRRIAAPGAPVYHCYWHGEGDMDGFAEAGTPPPLIKRTSEAVDGAFLGAGFRKKQGRLDTYEWGDMAFDIYTAAE
mmetsp:Transcript_8749/g.19825  ORF Transcript_8749/g.19825 Transcript_8749/m.19825 type:complete len:391 (+) Transcript_8749:133-1305(+)